MIMLFKYLLIAAIFMWIYNTFLGPKGRAWVDRRLFRSTDDLSAAVKIADLGTNLPRSGSMLHEAYPASLGLKLVSTGLAVIMLWMIIPTEGPVIENGLEIVDGHFLSGPYAWPEYVAICVIAFYYIIWISTYRVELRGNVLSYPTILFYWKQIDLQKLVRVEDDGGYNLRLYLADGKRGEILKQMRGKADLVARLRAFEAI